MISSKSKHFFCIIKIILDKHFDIVLINPKTTDFTRKIQGKITKNDKLDTLTICDALNILQRKNQYRITHTATFDFNNKHNLQDNTII